MTPPSNANEPLGGTIAPKKEEEFMDPILYAILKALCDKLGVDISGLGPAPTATATVKPKWWRPTTADAVAFSAKYGLPLAAILGWDGVTEGGNALAQKKLPPLAQGDTAGALEYAAFGYTPKGVHYLWTQDWIEKQRQFADKLREPGINVEAYCTNAKFTDDDGLTFQIMVGMVENPVLTPFRIPSARPETLDQTVAYLTQPDPASGGPGPSGQP